MKVLVTLLDMSWDGESECRKRLRSLVSPFHDIDLNCLIGEPENYTLRDEIWSSFDYPMSGRYIREGLSANPMAMGHVTEILDLVGFSYVVFARLMLADILNHEMALGTSPATVGEFGSPIFLLPTDLLGALYALMAEEAIGPVRGSRICPGCGISFSARHATRTICSPRCRQRVRRARKKVQANTSSPRN